MVITKTKLRFTKVQKLTGSWSEIKIRSWQVGEKKKLRRRKWWVVGWAERCLIILLIVYVRVVEFVWRSSSWVDWTSCGLYLYVHIYLFIYLSTQITSRFSISMQKCIWNFNEIVVLKAHECMFMTCVMYVWFASGWV